MFAGRWSLPPTYYHLEKFAMKGPTLQCGHWLREAIPFPSSILYADPQQVVLTSGAPQIGKLAPQKAKSVSFFQFLYKFSFTNRQMDSCLTHDILWQTACIKCTAFCVYCWQPYCTMQSLARATAKCCCSSSISRGRDRRCRLIFQWLASTSALKVFFCITWEICNCVGDG
jgi:hypothetical protein